MRYRTLIPSAFSLLLLLTTLHLCSSIALAADDDTLADDDYGYEETARVARVSLLAGDVSLRRVGSDKWERAALNTPLVEGDRLATGSGSRVEIQIDARNFVRVGEYATLDIVTLRAEGVALSLPEGTATLRLARFEKEREYFEIDAPATTVAAQAVGLYRLDVDKDGRVRVSVREGGRARLYSESSGFTLRDGRVAESVFRDNSNEADWEFSEVRPFDNWDTWVDERERHLLARLRYDDRDRYYDNQVVGGEELDAYGDWVQTNDYGYVWRPRTTVINNYYNWAPYRYGHWSWCPPYGWTWVGDEPWGWAPYHYGRWVYVNDYWCWAPRGYYGYNHRSWWRPALVAFVNVHLSFGDQVCWYPLPYHHSDPHSNFWRRARDRNKLAEVRRKELGNLARVNPIYQRAVSGLPARDFGRGNVRPRPADATSAKLALATDPVRGRLPVRPVEGEGGMANLRDRLSESKRASMAARGGDASGVPTLRVAERPTGASSRKPGVALDETLRRARIFDNRAPAVTKGAKGGDSFKDPNVTDPARRKIDGNVDGNTRGTGAVARPARPIRVPDVNNPADTRGEKGNGEKNGGDEPKRAVRPVRPTPDSDDARPRDGGVGTGETERRTKPADRDRRDGDGDWKRSPYERPAQPDARESRPAMPERSRERPEYKPSPVEKREPPVERREPPAERREPERRTEPAPRYERPDPPRHEERPAPPREERHSPPPREERPSPPPQRHEEKSPPPSKSEPARESAKPTKDRPPTMQ
ncbi:MAG TPA: DUF6600 domain-containing protein [Pyrinomonadaceae bacterium]|jgi:hypothetical protein|nr:DUF6600 domain-containing protein [Pyrinomonadaceae bacterium]